ncbi:MAG TPA: DMT family transporter [Thermoleophilaceae bacterium]|nr:DMT family transporter [Thermoleophilaceae bacterium]
MSRRSWVLFAVLSAVWGASYLLIKIGLRDFAPAVIVFGRTALAALALLALAARMGALAGLRRRLSEITVLALVQVAGPFLLITFGERHISSSLAGILVATAPIFTALLAIRVDHDERSHGLNLLGIVLGIAGVVLLLGVDAGGGVAALLGGLMVVLAGLGYALGGFYLKHRLSGLAPLGVSAATMSASALLTAPFAAASLPGSAPALGPAAAVAALGLIGTGVAFWIFYTLIATEGPAKASLVAYVAPGFAVVYGVSLLGESFTVGTAAGLVLIVGGSWLAAEGRLPGRRRAATPGGADLAREVA